MRTKNLALILMALAVVCGRARGQTFAVGWFTIDGGGGTSTGGVFQVSGTIGQPDAGALSGGSFSLHGGFWSVPAVVPTGGSPTLSISAAAPGHVTISWAPDTAGFVLQESANLLPGSWANAPSGGTNPINVPVGGTAKFYRLIKP